MQAKEGLHHGGSIADKVDFARNHGFKGVASRLHTKKLPRKNRKDPVHRDHRTEINQKIYIMGAGDAMKDGKLVKNNAATEYDSPTSLITPMGGFPHYGEVKQEFILLKGCVAALDPSSVFSLPQEVSRTHTKKRALEKFLSRVHRHQLQVLTRKVPDPIGQGILHGTSRKDRKE